MLFKTIVFLCAFIPMLAIAQNPYLDYDAAMRQGMIRRQMQERDMSPEQFRIEREINRILAQYQGVIIPVNRKNVSVIAQQVNTNDYKFVAQVINNHNEAQQKIHDANRLIEDIQRDFLR